MTHMPAQLKTIAIHVNGFKQDIPEGATLEDLLSFFHLQKKSVVVEHNRRVADKTVYGAIHLKDNDYVEIVHFVGGG